VKQFPVYKNLQLSLESPLIVQETEQNKYTNTNDSQSKKNSPYSTHNPKTAYK
jgi:hypothetical protein